MPDLAKTIGTGMAEFRKATEGATETLKETLRMDEIKQDVDEIKESLLSDKNHNAVRPPPPSAGGDKTAAASHPHDAASKDSTISG